MGLTPDDLRELLSAFEQSTWQEMTVTVAGDTLHVSRRADGAAQPPQDGGPAGDVPVGAPSVAGGNAHDAAPTPAGSTHVEQLGVTASQEAPAPVAPASASGTPVLAPSVGLFWRAPSPGAPPFVEVGSRVAPEDTIGIVEVMKLMNRVTAGVAGVVTAVLVENGGMVEHGQPLVLVDPSS